MCKKPFWLVLALIALPVLGGGIWWTRGQPQAATPTATRAVISWSVPMVTATVFPGTSSTTVVTFQSDRNLAGIVAGPARSFDSMVSVAPTSFASINANESYELTITLTAPPEFLKQTITDTIRLTATRQSPEVYEQVLPVTLQTDWTVVSPEGNLFSMNLPLGWRLTEVPSSGVHTYRIEIPDTTMAGGLYIYTPQQWTIIQQGEVSPVMLFQAGGYIYAYGNSEALSYDQTTERKAFKQVIRSLQTQ